MKKISILKISFILVLLAVFCINLFACGQNVVIRSDDKQPVIDNGIHEVSVKDTGKTIYSNGHTDYKIVIPENANSYDLTASSELNKFLSQATGRHMEIMRDNEVIYNSSSKFLSVGRTTLLKNAQLSADKDVLGTQGARVKTVNDSVFMFGYGDAGTLNAVYEFLTYTIGWEVYAYNEIVLNESKNVKLLNLDITEVPDIEIRAGGVGSGYRFDPMHTARLRIGQFNDIWMAVDGSMWHNTFNYLPKNVYKEEHPNWYATTDKQLCYTARGDAEEYRLMKEALFDKLLSVINQYPDTVQNITITHEDVGEWCSCSACKAEKAKYGTDAAVVIKFVNDISDMLKEHFDSIGEDRTVNLIFFAYRETEMAPAKKNSAGEWEPIDGLKTRDNVFVFYAPIMADYYRSFYHENNVREKELMDAWLSVTDKTYLWFYETNFHNYLYPFNNFGSLQNNYIFAKSVNAGYVFNQSQLYQKQSTAFHELKAWLDSKFGWNCMYDYNELLDKYFDNYFKEASVPMREYFNMLNLWMEELYQKDMGNGNVYYEIAKAEYFPFEVLNTWETKINQAYECINIHKTNNPELYQKLYDRICLESICIRYAQITLHPGKYSNATLTNMRNSFREDSRRLGIEEYKEGNSIENVFSAW